MNGSFSLTEMEAILRDAAGSGRWDPVTPAPPARRRGDTAGQQGPRRPGLGGTGAGLRALHSGTAAAKGRCSGSPLDPDGCPQQEGDVTSVCLAVPWAVVAATVCLLFFFGALETGLIVL